MTRGYEAPRPTTQNFGSSLTFWIAQSGEQTTSIWARNLLVEHLFAILCRSDLCLMAREKVPDCMEAFGTFQDNNPAG